MPCELNLQLIYRTMLQLSHTTRVGNLDTNSNMNLGFKERIFCSRTLSSPGVYSCHLTPLKAGPQSLVYNSYFYPLSLKTSVKKKNHFCCFFFFSSFEDYETEEPASPSEIGNTGNKIATSSLSEKCGKLQSVDEE